MKLQSNEEWKPYGYIFGGYTNSCSICDNDFMGSQYSFCCWKCANDKLLAKIAEPQGRRKPKYE